MEDDLSALRHETVCWLLAKQVGYVCCQADLNVLLYVLDATVDHALYVVRLHCNEIEFGAAFNDAVQRTS